MELTLRQIGIIMVLVFILAGWAAGLSWVFSTEWLPMFLSLILAGGFAYVLHFQQGSAWLARQFDARPVESGVLDRLYRKTDLDRKPHLYVTGAMSSANAFTVSCAEEDAIFVTPEIHRSDPNLKAPILAHEMAHVQHNDSLIMGFISVFEQMIGNLGRLWVLLLMGGLVGWLILLLFWPFLLLIHCLSLITLTVYQPLSTLLLRQREFQADLTAARWTSAEHMKRALKTLEHYNRQWIPKLLTRDEGPLSTHPPLEERLRKLDAVRTA
ncbi:MAG: M48 family metalloprotease [bacterium]